MSQSNEPAHETSTRSMGPRGVVAFARSQLRAVVSEAVQGSLHAITHPRAPAKPLDPAAVGERLRDAVFRDRGLRAAHAQAQSQPAVREARGKQEDLELGQGPGDAAPADEPIRTRTMARLLAQQGAYDRALRIYDLMLEETADPGLQREADSLRATLKR